jgi:cytidylate kinase
VVIGLFGASKVGKTSAATLLGKRLGCPVRHCGELVKAKARALGGSPNGIGIAEHARLDAETRIAANSAGKSLVIEGRFLDSVLFGCDITSLIQLTCKENERQRRFVSQTGSALTKVFEVDLADQQLRESLYEPCAPIVRPDLVLDTTETSLEETVDSIVQWLSRLEKSR